MSSMKDQLNRKSDKIRHDQSAPGIDTVKANVDAEWALRLALVKKKLEKRVINK